MENPAPDDRDEKNRDPLSGEPGAHPVGTGIGAVVGGAASGAVAGSVAGPVGTGVGAAVGAVVGGLVGKGVAEAVDPTAEEAYWNENYAGRPYVKEGVAYEYYRPAYRFGWEARVLHPDKSWDEVRPTLQQYWTGDPANFELPWEDAEGAVRDAWDRIGTAYPDHFTVR
ncbi:MAG TPA: hypothetical protein VFG55_01505 [Rhodanobacteraceae bacterium]|nr:hypothetical protein [Rhodanobacteraceae bacterium]